LNYPKRLDKFLRVHLSFIFPIFLFLQMAVPSHSLRQMKIIPFEYHIYGNNGFKMAGKARLRSPKIIRDLVLPQDGAAGFTFDLPTEDVMPRFTPRNGKVGFVSGDFFRRCRIVTTAEKPNPLGGIWMKICLQHMDTQEVLFLTASNFVPVGVRSVPAVAEGWHIFCSDVVAPSPFWANAQAGLA